MQFEQYAEKYQHLCLTQTEKLHLPFQVNVKTLKSSLSGVPFWLVSALVVRSEWSQIQKRFEVLFVEEKHLRSHVSFLIALRSAEAYLVSCTTYTKEALH